MKKRIKIIGILLVIMIVIIILLVINEITKKVTSDEIKLLEKQADISIYYFDGKANDMVQKSGKYALVNILQKKLYIIYWNLQQNGERENGIKTKNISNKKINELVKSIEEALYKDYNYQSREDIGIKYYDILYNEKNTKLAELPFSF